MLGVKKVVFRGLAVDVHILDFAGFNGVEKHCTNWKVGFTLWPLSGDSIENQLRQKLGIPSKVSSLRQQ